MDQYQYAFYLYENGAVIKKVWYGAPSFTEFVLIQNGIYYAEVFARDIETQRTVSVKSKPVYYLEGRKPNHIPLIRIDDIEMTNICNLSYPNCCTPVTSYHRGYIDDRTVLAALSWTQKGQTLNYHRQGEPLLHKELDKYIRWGVEAEVKPVISTNGILLDGDRLASLYRAGLRHLVITLHTSILLENFIKAYNWLRAEKIELRPFAERNRSAGENADIFYFSGNVLDFSDEVEQSRDVRLAVQSVREDAKDFLAMIPTHDWAGNIPGTRRDFSDESIHAHQKSCYYIQTAVVSMRWDGTVVGCCFDSENENELGHIANFTNIGIDLSKYCLCRHCSGNWTVD